MNAPSTADEGSFVTIISFPIPWPPVARLPIISSPLGGGTFTLNAEPDGRLSLHVVRDAGDEAIHRSAILRLAGTGFVLLTVIWSRQHAEFHINSHDVSFGMPEPFIVTPTAHSPSDQPAWLSPLATSQCADWIERRTRGRLAAPRAAKEGRRSKDVGEQKQELLAASKILSDLAILVGEGHHHLVGHLATELRALVSQGKKSNPLLIRVAARLGKPLPIYVVRKDQPLPVVDRVRLHVEAGMPSIYPVFPTHIIVDLEEWLSTPIVSLPGEAEGELLGSTPMDLIAGVSDTIGAAHYDEDVPIDIDTLRRIQQLDGNAVTAVLLTATAVISPLAKWLAESS